MITEKLRTKKVPFYADPGHGWAKVTRTELRKLNLLDKISSYSYQRGKHVYLEEDCDLSLYIEALQLRGIQLKTDYNHTNNESRIRSYEHFSYLTEEEEEHKEELRESLLKVPFSNKSKAIIRRSDYKRLKELAEEYKGYLK
jgi:hypothetical protein